MYLLKLSRHLILSLVLLLLAGWAPVNATSTLSPGDQPLQVTGTEAKPSTAAIPMAARDAKVWYVWAKKTSRSRWAGYGPYTYYDACNVRDDLLSKGYYDAYVSKK